VLTERALRGARLQSDFLAELLQITFNNEADVGEVSSSICIGRQENALATLPDEVIP
jgi:hypothetical protein